MSMRVRATGRAAKTLLGRIRSASILYRVRTGRYWQKSISRMRKSGHFDFLLLLVFSRPSWRANYSPHFLGIFYLSYFQRQRCNRDTRARRTTMASTVSDTHTHKRVSMVARSLNLRPDTQPPALCSVVFHSSTFCTPRPSLYRTNGDENSHLTPAHKDDSLDCSTARLLYCSTATLQHCNTAMRCDARISEPRATMIHDCVGLNIPNMRERCDGSVAPRSAQPDNERHGAVATFCFHRSTWRARQ